MEPIQVRTNKKLMLFVIVEFAIAIVCSYFVFTRSLLSYTGLLVIVPVIPIIYGVRLNRLEKKISGKKNIVLRVSNIVSILLTVFSVIYLTAVFVVMIMLFGSFASI